MPMRSSCSRLPATMLSADTVAERAGWDGTVEIVSQSLLLLASDPNTKQLIMDKGAVPVLIRLAKSPSEKTREACTLGFARGTHESGCSAKS